MTEDLIEEAITCAVSFREAADAWLKRKKDDGEYFPYATKESGALRRASLDLTRALARMRLP